MRRTNGLQRTRRCCDFNSADGREPEFRRYNLNRSNSINGNFLTSGVAPNTFRSLRNNNNSPNFVAEYANLRTVPIAYNKLFRES